MWKEDAAGDLGSTCLNKNIQRALINESSKEEQARESLEGGALVSTTHIYFVPEFCLGTKEISCIKPWYCACIMLVDFLLQEEMGFVGNAKAWSDFVKMSFKRQIIVIELGWKGP